MEIPRLMLAIAGKFPVSCMSIDIYDQMSLLLNFFQGDYVDGRFEGPTGDLSANLGRMPLLTVGDQSVGQSAAINFYIASENGFLGNNNMEAAQIIA